MKSQPIRLAGAAARAFSTTSEVCNVICPFTVATSVMLLKVSISGWAGKMARACVLPDEIVRLD